MKDFNLKLISNRDYSALYAMWGILGSIGTYMFGGWSGLLEILCLVFVIDYISGCVAAIKTGQGLKSSIGFWGLVKKGMMLLIVFLGHRIDVALGVDFVMNGSIYFWLANEGVSIFENYGKLKLDVPPVFKKIFAIFKEKAESQPSDNTKRDE